MSNSEAIRLLRELIAAGPLVYDEFGADWCFFCGAEENQDTKEVPHGPFCAYLDAVEFLKDQTE